MSIEQGIRQDDTWIAVDPIVGCAKDCQYCFLQTYGATPKKGEVILTPDQAIDNLISFATYRSESPVMLASETDAFMSPANIKYYSEFLQRYDERKIGNVVALVTKCHVPDSFIDLVHKLKNTKVLFYLSYSGLQAPIEPTTNVKRLRENFVRLAAADLPIIHYWRPFLPQNSSKEKIQEVIDHVSKYAKCSVAAGLKINDGILQRVEKYWPELNNASIDYSKVGAIWPEGAREYVDEYTRTVHPEYPVFWVNSCAVAHALNKPEFNGIYGGHICADNHCPSSQRATCSITLEEYVPSEEAIHSALTNVGLDTRTTLDEKNRRVIIHEDITHAQAIFLRQSLTYPVVTEGSITSANEWGGPVIGRENLYLPYNTKNFDLERIWDKALYIKKMFTEVERVEWNTETFLMELLVQVGHLADIILRQSHKLNFKDDKENSEILADEISDVFLNIFSIADSCGISLLKTLENLFTVSKYEILDGNYLYNHYSEIIDQEEHPFTAYFKLVDSCNLVIALSGRNENSELSSNLPKSLVVAFLYTLQIAQMYSVNLDSAFSKMEVDSKKFVERNSRAK